MREVYYHLGKLAVDDGDTAKAREYLRRSGYSDFDHPITLATPFSEDRASGHMFVPRRITEIVPGRVYALSGFEFTEYYFVVPGIGIRGPTALVGLPASQAGESIRYKESVTVMVVELAVGLVDTLKKSVPCRQSSERGFGPPQRS